MKLNYVSAESNGALLLVSSENYLSDFHVMRLFCSPVWGRILDEAGKTVSYPTAKTSLTDVVFHFSCL